MRIEQKTAVYAASLDPITYGHINIIERALKVFDHIIVAIGNNPSKKYTFSLEERVLLAKESLKKYETRITVTSFDGLLVDFVYSQGISTIVRGIRGTNDVEYEQLLNDINKSQRLGVDTFVLFADKELSHISSSAAKELQTHHAKNILEYVPMNVKCEMEMKISKQYFIGITGEIGAGKSYLAEKFINYFDRCNIKVLNIDFDTLGHYILETAEEPLFQNMRDQILERFGVSEINHGDSRNFINRKSLGKYLWGNETNLKWFNSLIVNGLDYLYRKQLSNFEGIVLVNGALLSEANLTHLCNNNVVVVEALRGVRQSRLKRRGYSDSDISMRMDSQFSAERKIQQINEKIVECDYGCIMRFENNIENENNINSFIFHVVAKKLNFSKLVRQ